jgi:hypothetical protein
MADTHTHGEKAQVSTMENTTPVVAGGFGKTAANEGAKTKQVFNVSFSCMLMMDSI